MLNFVGTMRIDLIKEIFNQNSSGKIWIAISPRNTITQYVGEPFRPLSFNTVPKSALDALKIMSDRNDIGIILYDPSSYYDTLNSVSYFLRNEGINVDGINKHPYNPNGNDVYYDILISDRSGFDMDRDWDIIKEQIGLYKLSDESIINSKINTLFQDINKATTLINDIYKSKFKNMELDLEIKFKINNIRSMIHFLHKEGKLTKVDITRIFSRNSFLWNELSDFH